MIIVRAAAVLPPPHGGRVVERGSERSELADARAPSPAHACGAGPSLSPLGRGSDAAQFVEDGVADAVEIVADVGVAEAEHAVALSDQVGRAGPVVFRLEGVAVTVEFDDQFFLPCSEVGDIGTDWHLPRKFHTHQAPTTQFGPQRSLRWRQVAAQRSCDVDQPLVPLHQEKVLSLILSPRRGERVYSRAYH